MDGLTRVVVTHWHLEAGMGMLEISVWVVSEVAGISSSGLEDPAVSVTGAELDSVIPYSGTEVGGGAGGVAVKV